jgi:formylglycine-generating enzyme required for sulfatase activity
MECSGVYFKGTSCKGYRLPTEAEWEYAARAGARGPTPCGNQSCLQQYAWFGDNSGRKPKPVARLKPNAWGLYDMLGNVYEWVYDLYSSGYYGSSPKNDPTGPTTGRDRAERGCAYYETRNYCRHADRLSAAPTVRYNSLGFRIVRTK